MSWTLRIPHRDPAQPLDVDALAELPQALDGEQRTVTRQVMAQAMHSGTRTVGALVDQLRAASPAQRREVLDRARAACGLPPTAVVDRQRDFEARQDGLRFLPERDESGRAFMVCAAEGCRTFPTHHATGGMATVSVRKWWCPAHEHLAAPGDMDPWSPRISYTKSGALRFPDDERDEVRERQDEQARRARREARRAEAQADAAAHERHEAAMAEHFRPKGGGWE